MSDEHPFSDDSIKKSLDKLKDVPPETADIGLVVEGQDIGVKGSINKDIGKPGGWEIGAEGSWMRKAGAKVAALLKWSGK